MTTDHRSASGVMRRYLHPLAYVAATLALAVAGFLTADTDYGFAALAAVGAAWLARDFHRSLGEGSA